MTNTVTLAIQVWFVSSQKLFLILKNNALSVSANRSRIMTSDRNLSKILNDLNKKNKVQVKSSWKPVNNLNAELYTILLIGHHYLFLTKILKSLKNEKVFSIQKKISKNYCYILFNSIRGKILFHWCENFFPTKDLRLNFLSLLEQNSKNYCIKFLKPILNSLLIWSIVSKKKKCRFSKKYKFYFKEIVKYSIVFNFKSLNFATYIQTENFFMFLKIALVYTNLNIKKRFIKITIKFISFIGIKIMGQVFNNMKKNLNKIVETIFKDIFTPLNCLNFKIINNLNLLSIFVPLSIVSRSNRVLQGLDLYYMKYTISTLIDVFMKNNFYRFILLSFVKNRELQFIKEKKIENHKINCSSKGNIKIYFWKIFFFKLFINLKFKKNTYFLSFLSLITIKNSIAKILKVRIEKYLFLNYDFKVIQIGVKLLNFNIMFLSSVQSLLKIGQKLNFKYDFYEIFYFTIGLILINWNSNKKSKVLEDILLLQNKILFMKKQTSIFEQTKQECRRLGRDLGISLAKPENVYINMWYKTGLSNIYKEVFFGQIYLYKIKFKDTPCSNYSINKNSHHDKKILELNRDIISIFSIINSIKVINFNIFEKPKKENQFLPLKIFRNIRLVSRCYFTENFREKQFTWNFEETKILIQGSSVYCFEYRLYFFQIKYYEALILLSFNRCDIIFKTESDFLLEIVHEKQKENLKNAEERGLLKIFKEGFVFTEKFYLLNVFFLPNCHLFKTDAFISRKSRDKIVVKSSNISDDHIYIIEAGLMKVLKIKNKIKSNHLLFTLKKKLSRFLNVDPRGIMIQLKTLNEREYINFSLPKNTYSYLLN
jgi:hypothetical protein